MPRNGHTGKTKTANKPRYESECCWSSQVPQFFSRKKQRIYTRVRHFYVRLKTKLITLNVPPFPPLPYTRTGEQSNTSTVGAYKVNRWHTAVHSMESPTADTSFSTYHTQHLDSPEKYEWRFSIKIKSMTSKHTSIIYHPARVQR